jgi:hypothetical protein
MRVACCVSLIAARVGRYEEMPANNAMQPTAASELAVALVASLLGGG